MYEWNIYEPSVDALITPLMFSFAGDGERDTLRQAGADPRAMYPTATLYRRLADRGVRCVAFHPASFAPSTYDGVLLDGAVLHPYETLDGAFDALADELRAGERRSTRTCTSTPSTRPAISTGRPRRRSTPRWAGASTRSTPRCGSLPAGTLRAARRRPRPGRRRSGADALRQRVVARDRRASAARRPRPSARPGRARRATCSSTPRRARSGYVIDRLRALLGAHADGPRHRRPRRGGAVRRLARPAPGRRGSATSASFPRQGETVWWRERGRFGMRFRGHHGGLTPDEAHTRRRVARGRLTARP